MFDLSSTKLLILGVVALLVVGPKDLPMLLRTVGKYVGMLRRQAAEFRTQFDDAMRESELDQIKKQVETMGADVEKTMREAEMSVEKEVSQANAELDAAMAKDAPPAFGQLDNLGAPAVGTPESAPAAPVSAPAASSTSSSIPDKVGA